MKSKFIVIRIWCVCTKQHFFQKEKSSSLLLIENENALLLFSLFCRSENRGSDRLRNLSKISTRKWQSCDIASKLMLLTSVFFLPLFKLSYVLKLKVRKVHIRKKNFECGYQMWGVGRRRNWERRSRGTHFQVQDE